MGTTEITIRNRYKELEKRLDLKIDGTSSREGKGEVCAMGL